MKRPTRKNRKNHKNRNKRPNIKIKGEPRSYNNHIEVDIEFFRTNVKKSRKRNGGGDFSKENCDATPLIQPIGFDNIVAMDQLNLQSFGHTNEGSGSIVTITKCIPPPTSGVNAFALRIFKTSVSIDQLNDEEHRPKIQPIFQPIIDEYNRQIELSVYNYTPKLFYICFLHIKFIKTLLGPTHSITMGTTDDKYFLCSVMEKVETIREVNIKHMVDVIRLLDDVVNNSKIVFIDIKPDNIGYNSNGQIVFLDLESKYCCRLSELSFDYMSSEEEISSFCICLMKYIFISYVIYNYDLGEDTDLSELIAIIKEINSTTFTLFGEANIPFLHVVAIIHTLQDTEHRFFPATVLYKAIINGYIWGPATDHQQRKIYKNKQFSNGTDLISFYNQVTLRKKLGEVSRNKVFQREKYITKLEEHKRNSGR